MPQYMYRDHKTVAFRSSTYIGRASILSTESLSQVYLFFRIHIGRLLPIVQICPLSVLVQPTTNRHVKIFTFLM